MLLFKVLNNKDLFVDKEKLGAQENVGVWNVTNSIQLSIKFPPQLNLFKRIFALGNVPLHFISTKIASFSEDGN